MGACSSSDSEKKSDRLTTAAEGADILDTYLRVDRDIFREERNPPVPALGLAMVKLDRLTVELDQAMQEVAEDREDPAVVPGTISELDTVRLENYDESIRRVIHELSLNRMPDLAMEHEEFLANLNKKSMKQHRVFWLNRRKDDTQEEVTRLSERVQHLQALFYHHDTLTRSVGAPKPDLTAEADRLRSYRDTLYSGELAWRDSAHLVQAAATLCRTGVDSYAQLPDTLNYDSRWRLAQETRNCIQEAVLCVNAAQTSLPGVQFPYCSRRELQAIVQVLEYIFTDIQIPDRYKHGSEVYNSFQKRSTALYQWITKMTEETIHKDVIDADLKLAKISTKMTNQTANNIRQLAGLGGVKGYDPESLAARIREDYDRKIITNHVINHNSLLLRHDPIRPTM